MGLGLLLAAMTSTVTATAAAPRIDLITIGVGEAAYATFGHAALRVVEADGTDTAYNFGGVDMEQPNFWMRLVQGRIEAYLKVTPYSDLLLEYSAEDRTIVGRTLRFEPDVARAIVKDLEENAKPENRTYLYHHIFDNCTTRIAQLLDRHLGGRLKSHAGQPVPGTHRDWILDRVRWKPATYLAMDLMGNGMGDVPIVAWDTIFIPEAVDAIIDSARFDGQPFVVRKFTEYRSLSYTDMPPWDWPWLKVYLLLGLPLILLGVWRPTLGARVLGALWGSMGLVYTAFWLLSEYDFYHANWNMLVFPPLHLALVVLARRAVARTYLMAHVAVLLLLALLVATGAIVQSIGPMITLALLCEVPLGGRMVVDWVALTRRAA
ncbi:MAG: DUF4105 domain-containing protein [Deltaproteobacteria bacterium]|jgi:hypothetical protein